MKALTCQALERLISLRAVVNPKEFIQRRGRILRQFLGKEYAEIHDLIAIPPIDYRQYPTATFRTERKNC